MDLADRLAAHGQDHLLEHLRTLPPEAGKEFSGRLSEVDWSEVQRMHRQSGPGTTPSLPEGLHPPQGILPTPEQTRQWHRRGLEHLAKGEVGFVLMAGGQGSRLGFEGPKGACPLGLPQDLVLFEVLSRRLERLAEMTGCPVPFAVMTGPDNDKATREWFHSRPEPRGTSPEFFEQSSAPALDDRGRALLSAPGQLALVPDGNGGIWERLRTSGILAAWKSRGVRWIHVAGVDNLLSLPCDPVFVGFAEHAGKNLSVKSVLRTDPAEKVGVYALDGADRPRVAEYTELSVEAAGRLDPDGLPHFREANIASHLVRMDALEAFASLEMPWHLARKRIPHIDPRTGTSADGELSCKYERFLFDAFGAADGISVLRVDRAREFAPVKNATGNDSPESAREALASLHRNWLRAWGEPEGSAFVDPRRSFSGERPGTRGEEASF